jgi:alanyl aminopeptidase
VRTNEIRAPLSVQVSKPETREAAWAWIEQSFVPLTARLPDDGAGSMPWYASTFCSEEKAAEVEAFFAPRIDSLPGGPRNLAGALEAIRLCASLRTAQAASAEAFFTR